MYISNVWRGNLITFLARKESKKGKFKDAKEVETKMGGKATIGNLN